MKYTYDVCEVDDKYKKFNIAGTNEFQIAHAILVMIEKTKMHKYKLRVYDNKRKRFCH